MKQVFANLFFAAAILTVLSGCGATTGSSSTTSGSSGQGMGQPARPEPPRADRNLIGFSVEYRQGYHDGCTSAKRSSQVLDEARFKTDADYRLGWQDGLSICTNQFKK